MTSEADKVEQKQMDNTHSYPPSPKPRLTRAPRLFLGWWYFLQDNIASSLSLYLHELLCVIQLF